MSKIQKKNLLVLSVAALVASSVAAIAGVTTYKNDLVGGAVYLAQDMCGGSPPSGNCWCDFTTHAWQCGDYSGGSPSGGSPIGGTTGASTTTSTTTTSSTTPACPTADLKSCQATCTSQFCMNWCSQACPTSTSTTTSTTTTTTVTDRCAHANEDCAERVRCLIELGACSSPKTGEKQMCDDIKSAATARGVKNAAVNMQTGTEYCDELKAATPPAPAVPEPALAPAAVTPAPAEETTERASAPAIEGRGDFRNFEDESFEGDEGDFDGGSEDFGGFDDFSDDGFHDSPEDFGFQMEDFGNLGNFYDMDFDPEMMQEGFDEYFGSGDDFGDGMPEWMGDELESTKDMMRGMAEEMCPDFVEEIGDVEDFEELEEVGFRMQEECGGGPGMGGEGGVGDGEMMENAVKMLDIFADTEGPVYFALDVAKKHDVFTNDEVKEIEGIIVKIGEKAKEAEEACSDLPDLEEEGDFFGIRGLLAQLFDDEENDDEFEDDEDEGESFDNEDDFGEDIREEFEACGRILDEALGAGPGKDEEEIGSGLMGALEELMREPMENAVEDGTIPQEEWDEVENRFNAVMEELGFEEEFDESFDEEEGFREVDKGEWEVEEGGTDEEEEDFEDFDF